MLTVTGSGLRFLINALAADANMCLPLCALKLVVTRLHLPHFFAAHIEELLFVAFGSGVPADSVAVSHTWPTAERQETEIATESVPNRGKVAHVQVTFFPTTEQVPPPDAFTAAG